MTPRTETAWDAGGLALSATAVITTIWTVINLLLGGHLAHWEQIVIEAAIVVFCGRDVARYLHRLTGGDG